MNGSYRVSVSLASTDICYCFFNNEEGNETKGGLFRGFTTTGELGHSIGKGWLDFLVETTLCIYPRKLHVRLVSAFVTSLATSQSRQTGVAF